MDPQPLHDSFSDQVGCLRTESVNPLAGDPLEREGEEGKRGSARV